MKKTFDTTSENEESNQQKKISGWPFDTFKPKKESISKLKETIVPVLVHPGNLSFSNSYNSIQTSALNKKKYSSEKKSGKKKFLRQVEKYCENTTLHGLRYVGDPELTFGERIFWFISFSLAIVFATYYISNIYTKWKSSPVIISFSPFETDLSTIPFPAVTICNMNQAKKSEAELILRNGSQIEKYLLDDSCNGNSTFNDTENINFESLRNFLIRVGNTCSDILKLCKWGNIIVNCSDIFYNDLTDEGLCCSFNRLPPEIIYRNWEDLNFLNQTYPKNVDDWNAEKGFSTAITANTIPKRAIGAGAHLGLSVVLDAEIDDYYCSSTRSTGFKVKLSDPIETPKMADFGFLVSTGFETRIAVQPSVRTATASLRSVPIEKRQCYFANERPLQYYRSYTQRNCLLECQSTYTIKLCGCVPYYLTKSKEVPFCGKMEKGCVEKAKQDMETVTANSSSCNCLPDCFSVQYPYGKSMSILSKGASADLLNMSSEYLEKNIAAIHFFFFNSKFLSETKSELFGFTEILSNTGGLLSLSLGFSFLSFVELVYFIFIKVICNMNNRSNKNTENIKEETVT